MRTARRAAKGSGLTAAELGQLRGMLEQQQRFRVEQLAALAHPERSGPLGSAYDEVTESLVAGARAALADVRAALARMADGSYGRCTQCSTRLGRERLEVLPQVATCMPCQRGAQPATRSAAGWGIGRAASSAAGNGHAEG